MRHSERKPLTSCFLLLATMLVWAANGLAAVESAAATEVTPVSASLSGPESAPARSVVHVTWEGPGNELDHVAIQPAGSESTASGPYAYTSRGPELRMEAPHEPGKYEIRYLAGGSNRILASQPLTVTPAPPPGTLQVVDARGPIALGTGAAVTVILDASGSMLQPLDGERRIDIAQDAVMQLVSESLPDDVRFSLRAFGHRQPESCRPYLEIPLGPLDRAQVRAVVESIEPIRLARTPIARALAEAGAELSDVVGPHLFILLVGGQDTCDGDPGAVIRDMVASGLDVRVNIVGLAIDELMLREDFESWAGMGNGRYIDVPDAEDLAAGFSQAVYRAFRVLDDAGLVIAGGAVNGPAIELPAGDYTIRVGVPGEEPVDREAAVVEDALTVVNLDEP